MLKCILGDYMIVFFSTSDVLDFCTNVEVLKVISFIKQILGVILLLVPMFLIVMITIDFSKGVIGNESEMKKKPMMVIKRLLLVVLLFLVRPIVDFTMNTLTDIGSIYTQCYTNADATIINDLGPDVPSSHLNISKGVFTFSSKSTTVVDGDSDDYCDKVLGCGYGKATNISIKYNVSDSKNRCGNSPCASIATVKYPKKTVTYYMGAQGQEGVDANYSCRINAFMAAVNAVTDGNHSSYQLHSYLKSKGYTSHAAYLNRASMNDALVKYKVKKKAKVYYNTGSFANTKKLIKTGLDHGQPVMIFVSRSKCPDLSNSGHALLLLGYDSKGYIVFIDSNNKVFNQAHVYKKRKLDAMTRCMVDNGSSFYKMIVFKF